jgi:hypothetical protein
MFWWDFLVGDTPEITIAVLVVLGLVAVISKFWHANTVAYVCLPVLMIVALTLSVNRARRGAKNE